MAGIRSFMAEMTGAVALQFLLSLLTGCLISVLLGMCIGLNSKNVGAANALAVPFAMLFAFMPMLAAFNKTVENVARFTYGQQISYLMEGKGIEMFGGVVVAVNALILLVLSVVLYGRMRLDE